MSGIWDCSDVSSEFSFFNIFLVWKACTHSTWIGSKVLTKTWYFGWFQNFWTFQTILKISQNGTALGKMSHNFSEAPRITQKSQFWIWWFNKKWIQVSNQNHGLNHYIMSFIVCLYSVFSGIFTSHHLFTLSLSLLLFEPNKAKSKHSKALLQSEWLTPIITMQVQCNCSKNIGGYAYFDVSYDFFLVNLQHV